MTGANPALEGSPLIASDRVEGTAVRRPDGGSVGTVKRLVIEKVSGRVAYAVVSLGGFLGLGEGEHVLPWSALTYNPEAEAYEVSLAEDELRQAPAYRALADDPSDDPEWAAHVKRYFNRPAYEDEAIGTASHEAKAG